MNDFSDECYYINGEMSSHKRDYYEYFYPAIFILFYGIDKTFLKSLQFMIVFVFLMIGSTLYLPSNIKGYTFPGDTSQEI